MAERAARPDVSVRPLAESDLPAADEIMRVAFGTFLGVPEPRTFMGDAALVRPRWRSNPTAAFAAELDGTLVGSNFATRWGSFGFFGPLTVRPDLWDLGIGKRLLEPVMGCFELWRVTHAGLFTFAHSQKHVGLYQRFGFWPRFLTAIMAKPVSSEQHASPEWSGFSRAAPEQRAELLRACRDLTDAVYDGLDLSRRDRSGCRLGSRRDRAALGRQWAGGVCRLPFRCRHRRSMYGRSIGVKRTFAKRNCLRPARQGILALDNDTRGPGWGPTHPTALARRLGLSS